MMSKKYNITFHYDGGIDKWDVIYVNGSQCAIVINKIEMNGGSFITCYPYFPSKYRFVRWYRFLFLKIRVWLRVIR